MQEQNPFARGKNSSIAHIDEAGTFERPTLGEVLSDEDKAHIDGAVASVQATEDAQFVATVLEAASTPIQTAEVSAQVAEAVSDAAIDANAVTAQTAALNTAMSGEGTVGMNDTVAQQDSNEDEGETTFADTGFTKAIFTKKINDPALAKRRKKIAAASRRRNRRA